MLVGFSFRRIENSQCSTRSYLEPSEFKSLELKLEPPDQQLLMLKTKERTDMIIPPNGCLLGVVSLDSTSKYLSSSSTENKKVACKKGEENSPIISKPERRLIRTPQTTAEFLPHSAQIKGVLCLKAGSDQHFHVGGVRRFTLLQPQSAQVETIQCLTQSWELPNHPNSKFWNRHWNRMINVFL